MNEKNTGGPAFPSLNAECTGIDSDGHERWSTEPSGGMTLRDYFAAKAMQATLSEAPDYHQKYEFIDLAYFSYKCADAMLKAREE